MLKYPLLLSVTRRIQWMHDPEHHFVWVYLQGLWRKNKANERWWALPKISTLFCSKPVIMPSESCSVIWVLWQVNLVQDFVHFYFFWKTCVVKAIRFTFNRLFCSLGWLDFLRFSSSITLITNYDTEIKTYLLILRLY